MLWWAVEMEEETPARVQGRKFQELEKAKEIA